MTHGTMEVGSESTRSSDTRHRLCFIILVVINAAAYIAALIASGINITLFDNSPAENATNEYYNDVTPAGPTFAIWGVIYVWNALWVGFTLYLIFQKKDDGTPLYLNPVFLPPQLFVFFSLTSVDVAVWFSSVYRDPPEVAIILLFFMAFFQYICFFFTYRSLDRASPTLVEQGRAKVIWQVRGLVFNGMGTFATWVSIATIINLSYLMRIRSDFTLSVETSGLITLAILSVCVTAYVIADLVFLDRYTRYTITPYCVVVVAFVGSVAKNYRQGSAVGIFLVVLLAASLACLVLKVGLTIYRHKTRPPFRTRMAPNMEPKI